MMKRVLSTMTILVAAVVLLGAAGFAHGATVTWDGGAGDDFVHRPQNWTDDQLPTNTFDGIVPTGIDTLMSPNLTLTDYHITFNGNSTFTGQGGLLDDGTTLVFNDTSFIDTQVSRLYLSRVGSSPVSVTFNDSSSADLAENLSMGDISSPYDAGASTALYLNDQSTFTIAAAVNVNAYNGGTQHSWTLAGQSVLTVEGTTGVVSINDHGTLLVNFVQTARVTPTWRIHEGALASQSFQAVWIQYQINGVNTTLADERFVLTEGVGGYDVLQLVIPPAQGTVVSVR